MYHSSKKKHIGAEVATATFYATASLMAGPALNGSVYQILDNNASSDDDGDIDDEALHRRRLM